MSRILESIDFVIVCEIIYRRMNWDHFLFDSQNKCSKNFDLDEKEETSTFFQLENDSILMAIQFLNPEEAPAPAASYSNLAILPPGKRILVIAGQIGNLIDGSMVEGLEA